MIIPVDDQGYVASAMVRNTMRFTHMLCFHEDEAKEAGSDN